MLARAESMSVAAVPPLGLCVPQRIGKRKGRMADALALTGDEGRDKLR